MPDFKMGNPAKTIISQSGTANPTWGTGAPTGAIVQVKKATLSDILATTDGHGAEQVYIKRMVRLQ